MVNGHNDLEQIHNKMKFGTYFYIDLRSYLTKIHKNLHNSCVGNFFYHYFLLLIEDYLKNLRFTTNITKKIIFPFPKSTLFSIIHIL